MAQPSQVFPPWLTPTPVVITDAAGAPVATETSIEYIPPTYFGPSIPLGTLYSFGGTSEPATVILPGQITTSAAATSLTTTATPSSTSLTTTSATSSTSTASSSSGLSSSSTITTSATVSATLSQSASPSATSVAPLGGSSSLSKGQLVGIIVASILAVIVSFVAAITLYLCLKGRRKRRSQFNTVPIDDDYEVIPPGGRIPGDGSPRHSGEEFDPFLQRHSGAPSGEAAEALAAGAAVGAVGGAAASRAGPLRAPRVPAPPVPTNGSKSSGSTANTGSDSSNSNASGFGVLLDRPSLGLLPSMPEHDETGGQPLSPTDMARIQRESVLPDEEDDNQYDENGEYTGAYAISQDPPLPPPRLVEPSASTPLLGGEGENVRPPFMTQPSYLSEKSSFGSQEEGEPSILTARRVRAEDLGPRTNSDSSAGPSHRPSTGLLGALGLGGLANIGRLSWFRNLDSPRNSRAIATPDYTSDPLSEKDIETGRSALPRAPRNADSFGARLRPGGVGTLADGSRPISGASGRSGASGGTQYHDAQSSLGPGTPLLAPLPRALTPAEQPQPPATEQAWITSPLNVGSAGTPPPPAYTDRPLGASSTPPPRHSPNPSLGNEGADEQAGDILDMPAPAALDHFASISSLKDTPTGSSFGNSSFKPSPFPPPGLETIRPIGWSSADTATTASRGSFAGVFGHGVDHVGDDHALNISVDDHDVLDEAPPDAEQGWRTMSSSAGSHSHGGASLAAVGGGIGDPGRRGTFGLYVPHNPSINSEQGSLHSMRSHFSPAASIRSSGSAPASRPDRELRKDGSISSNSSRPSAHSVARSLGSGVSVAAHSLMRTGSITEDERRKSSMPISPAVSAFGHHQQRTSSSGEHDHPRQPSSPLAMVTTIGSPPTAHLSPEKPGTIRAMSSVGSGGSATLADTSFGTSDTARPVHFHEEDGEDVGLLSPARSMSPPISVSNAPWAGGLAGDWQPTP